MEIKCLVCECVEGMIEIFKKGENFEENLRDLVDELGVEENGMYWCMN